MKFSLSFLLSGFIGLSSLAHARINDFSEDDFNPANKNQECPAVIHEPTSCSLLDKAACMIDLKNIHFVNNIVHLFSKQKGECVVFTTEHFQEILEKMRALNITQEDLEQFRTDPNLCVERLRPVIELAATHADLQLNETLLKQFCEETSLAYWAMNVLRSYAKITVPAQQVINTAVVLAIASLGYHQGGMGTASAYTAVSLLVYTLFFGSTPAKETPSQTAST